MTFRFPNELQQLIGDYCVGPIKFWKHYHMACLVDINERIRPDDTYSSYFLRTAWLNDDLLSNLRVDEFHNQINLTIGITEFPIFATKNPLKSIIHEAFESIFSEYDYDACHGTTLSRLIVTYLGWFYEFVYE